MPYWGYSKLSTHDGNFLAAADDSASILKQLRLYRILSALLLVLNLAIVGAWLGSTPDCSCTHLVYSPGRSATRYEKRRLFRSIVNNVYTGDPRPEHDEAWKKLIEPIAIKISPTELKLVNETSISFADGSGYLAEPAVYHELHCIKRIRRHLHLDYYYPNMTEDQRLREGPHIDHCLEYLREAAMCRGDTTVATFQWAAGKPFSHVSSEHECVNWEVLDAWARTRMADLSNYAILKPPADGEQ